MWVLIACAAADPDALLRAGDARAASEAWQRLHGEPLDLDHPAAEILLMRRATAAFVADAMEAIRLLERGRRVGTQVLDRPFDSAEALLAGVGALAVAPALVAVGRSEGRGDADPLVGGPLPWRGGRLVGAARTDMASLGATLDADPPARLVTFALRDATGELWIYAERGEGAWVARTTTDASAAARVLLAAEVLHDQGREVMLARVGKGILAR